MTGTELIPVDYAQQRTQALARLREIDEKEGFPRAYAIERRWDGSLECVNCWEAQ